ncbi:MAG: hypothetical protein FWC62_05055 [Firmicutes bacterium]|nr:hypothetical protein [Bacillota bacterium]
MQPIENSGLVDISSIAVDKDLSKDRRVAEFVHRIRNPYRFRCGDFTVSARFSENGPTFEECLQRLVSQ